MYKDSISVGCKKEELPTQQTVERHCLVGQNELIPYYRELYKKDVEEPVYVVRIVRGKYKETSHLHNIIEVPWGPCDPAASSGLLCNKNV